MKKKASNRGRKRVYTPPIAWDRLDAMRMALQQYMGPHRVPLSDEMAKELANALLIISQSFQSQISKRGAPRNEANWRIASLARVLVRLCGADQEEAIHAALDSCRSERVADDDLPIIEIFNRIEKEAPGGDRYFPAPQLLDKARQRLAEK